MHFSPPCQSLSASNAHRNATEARASLKDYCSQARAEDGMLWELWASAAACCTARVLRCGSMCVQRRARHASPVDVPNCGPCNTI